TREACRAPGQGCATNGPKSLSTIFSVIFGPTACYVSALRRQHAADFLNHSCALFNQSRRAGPRQVETVTLHLSRHQLLIGCAQVHATRILGAAAGLSPKQSSPAVVLLAYFGPAWVAAGCRRHMR